MSGTMAELGYGGSATRLGDIKTMTYAGPPLLVDADGSEWLRTGNLLAYQAKYAALLNDQPGLLVSALPARTNFSGSNYAGFGAKLFANVSGYNVLLAGGTSGGWTEYKASTDLSYSGSASLNGYLFGVYGAMRLIGGSSNTLVAFGANATAAAGCCALVAAGAPQATDLPTSASYGCGVSGLTNAVVARLGAGSNSVYLYTTTNGLNYTQRTGSGGTSDTLQSMHYAPCASAYLYVVGPTSGAGPAALNRTTDGYTQTACTLPAGVLFVAGDSWEKRYAASSTASLFLLADGRILRTTNGTSFAAIDLTSFGVSAPGATAILAYDAVNSRFLIAQAGGGTANPWFLYSGDDGVTWQASTAFEDLTAGATLANATSAMAFGPATVSSASKFVMLTGVGTSASYGFDITGLAMRSPQYVGAWRPFYQFGNNLLNLPAYVKVKTP